MTIGFVGSYHLINDNDIDSGLVCNTFAVWLTIRFQFNSIGIIVSTGQVSTAQVFIRLFMGLKSYEKYLRNLRESKKWYQILSN